MSVSTICCGRRELCGGVYSYGTWWKETVGPLLGELRDGTVTAFLPTLGGGYFYCDGQGRRIKVGSKNAGEIGAEAYCFLPKLSPRPLKLMDFLKFRLESISVGDIIWVLAASLCVSLLGLVLPMINKLIFDNIIPGNLREDILPVAALLVGATVGSLLFGISAQPLVSRLRDKMSFASQSAVMARFFLCPCRFQRNIQPELSQRVSSMEYRFANCFGQYSYNGAFGSVFLRLSVSDAIVRANPCRAGYAGDSGDVGRDRGDCAHTDEIYEAAGADRDQKSGLTFSLFGGIKNQTGRRGKTCIF